MIVDIFNGIILNTSINLAKYKLSILYQFDPLKSFLVIY